MRNDYGNRIPYAEYAEAFSRIRLPLIIPSSGVPNLEPLDEVWPTGTAPIIRPVDGGVELAQVGWGLAPSQAKALVVINLRFEGRSFGRCANGKGFALLTVDAGSYVAPIRARQPAVLARDAWTGWLEPRQRTPPGHNTTRIVCRMISRSNSTLKFFT